MQVAVCGPSDCTTTDEENAFQVGRLLADQGVAVLCGGGAGVMAAVAAGARSRDGVVVGICPGSDTAGASPDLSVTLVTNMGQARNAIIVWSADAVIAVGGSWGTLSEVALAMRRGAVPVVTLGGWQVVDAATGVAVAGPVPAATPQEAVEIAVTRAGTPPDGTSSGGSGA